MAWTDNLVSHWKLNEASGTRNDSHGTNHLTDNNTVTSATGKIGDAADCELDNNEWLSIADNASLSMGSGVSMTIVAWVNAETLNNNTVICGKWTPGSEYVLGYSFTGNSRFQFFVTDGGGSTEHVDASSLGAPSTATWYLIIAGWSDADDQLFISVNNGTVDTVAWSGGVRDQTNDFTIGAYGGGGSGNWDGLVDSVSLWKRVLTADEKTQLYNGGNGLDYPFPDGHPAMRRLGGIRFARPCEVGRYGVKVS